MAARAYRAAQWGPDGESGDGGRGSEDHVNARLISVLSALGALAVLALAFAWSVGADPTPVVADAAADVVPDDGPADTSGSASPAPSPSPTPVATPSKVPAPEPEPPAALGSPHGTVPGILQFRGNPQHTWYGEGPVPRAPVVTWGYPDQPMCVEEEIGEDEEGEPILKEWCGTGWTGQPLLWERPDGVTEMIVGAYDGAIHFLDAATGTPTRPPFRTGFMIKGTLTLDPDGHPLLYGGSRDDHLRVIALDRELPTELWRLGPHPNRVWNNDWDGNPSVVDGILYVGGEDSWFYAIELNRSLGADGLVQVAPEVLVEVPGWNDQLIRDVGDWNVSIESSVVVADDRAYFTNSGGRVVGLDISRVRQGEAPVVFDYWLGDDADASLVLDADGMLYATVELERGHARAREVGQLVKLDPTAPGDPRVWGVAIPPRPEIEDDAGGAWSTPALHDGTLYLTTHPGDLLAVDAETGEVVYRERIGYHEWSSPAVVLDDGRPVLTTALCEGGGLRAYDVSDRTALRELWTVHTPKGTCVESTPAVWRGGIYVGSRDGHVYRFGDAP